MGCCLSRSAPSSSSSPQSNPVAPQDHPSTSRQALAPPSPTQRSSLASRSTRPNAPLRPINPAQRSTLPATLASPTVESESVGLRWTRARLEKERNDWWETRVAGQVEVWAAVRLIVQLLQRGEVGEAQGLLDASECTCPNGEIWRGVYDEGGEYYKVPEWIVIEPAGLVENEEEGGIVGRNVDGVREAVDEDGDHEEEDAGTSFKVRCRLSSTQKDVLITMHEGELVGSLLRKLREKTGMPPTTRLRVAFSGKFYDVAQQLEANPQWRKDYVLNIMVFE